MRIVFFGSGKFAVTLLEAIHAGGHEISLVVTQPDKKKGRHLHLSGTPVKEYALTHHLNIFQPSDINLEESSERLKKEKADVFVVVSYGKILSKKILCLAKKMSINIHASLLPEYRGAAPINRALINGERTAGITFIKMNEYMDRGDIMFQKAIPIGREDHVVSLEEKLSRLASGSINEILSGIENNKSRLRKQNEKAATYAPLMKKHDGLIHWNSTPEEIYNQFRGCFGWPGSFTHYKGKVLKILSMEPGQKQKVGKPGEVVCAENDLLEVACLSGTVLIKEVLPESHKKMSVKSFLAGHRVKPGDLFGIEHRGPTSAPNEEVRPRE